MHLKTLLGCHSFSSAIAPEVSELTSTAVEEPQPAEEPEEAVEEDKEQQTTEEEGEKEAATAGEGEAMETGEGGEKMDGEAVQNQESDQTGVYSELGINLSSQSKSTWAYQKIIFILVACYCLYTCHQTMSIVHLQRIYYPLQRQQ